MRQTLAGLSGLAQLIGEHIQKSKDVLNRLHLLSLNSMILASSLGSHADRILAIAKIIVEISAEWRENTDQSGNAMQDILKHVEQTNRVMEAFSECRSDKLHAAQAQTRSALDSLKAAAAFAARQSGHIESANEAMHTKIAQVESTGELLDRDFGRIDAILDEIEMLKQQMEIDHPSATNGFDANEVEHLYSAAYTTEVERDVLRAALHGTAIPLAQQSFGGNSIELF
jgi:chromosome segregation ATPase